MVDLIKPRRDDLINALNKDFRVVKSLENLYDVVEQLQAELAALRIQVEAI